MYAIETANLSYKVSARERILRDINLCVPQGAIYGFLGPNGAGKTTTIKLLLGLLKKQEGAVRILGKSFQEHRIPLLQQIGALIESPSLYANLTAEENLKVVQKIHRCPEKRIPQVLEMVGLAGTGNKRAGRFSLGMKQRLGIAMALIHRPALLILDEPTNGLDPNGIIEMRELLRELNEEYNMTILVSSHMLAEVEKLVSHIGIIDKGTMLFQGTWKELQARQDQASTRIETDDPYKAAGIASASGTHVTVDGDAIVLPFADKQMIARLNQQLVEGTVAVNQIRTGSTDLESIFIDLLKNNG